MERQPQILIVENQKSWQDMLSGALRKAGFSVEQAFHHGEALAMLRHQEFDLVIVDLNLPGTLHQARFEGEDILEALKAKGLFSIVVTGYATTDHNLELEDKYAGYGLYMVLDKLRFAEDETFLNKGFPELVRRVLSEAERAKQADGLADDQLDRLSETAPPSK